MTSTILDVSQELGEQTRLFLGEGLVASSAICTLSNVRNLAHVVYLRVNSGQ